jgi:hypothetical protein
MIFPETVCAMRSTLVTTVVGLVFVAALTHAAEARGGHGFGRGFGGHGMHGTAGDRRHGNDAYTKAASDEEDKLLAGKLKSICRGC